jgi:hypothetical protein
MLDLTGGWRSHGLRTCSSYITPRDATRSLGGNTRYPRYTDDYCSSSFYFQSVLGSILRMKNEVLRSIVVIGGFHFALFAIDT